MKYLKNSLKIDCKINIQCEMVINMNPSPEFVMGMRSNADNQFLDHKYYVSMKICIFPFEKVLPDNGLNLSITAHF